MHGCMGFRKTYVDVVANIDVDGRVTPLSIRWRDGRTFEIDRVHEAIRRASTRVGGTGCEQFWEGGGCDIGRIGRMR